MSTSLQEPKCSFHTPMCFLKSDSKLHLNLCLSVPEPKPLIRSPLGFCRILGVGGGVMPVSPYSFSTETYLYIMIRSTFWTVLYFFFLIALFAFDFLNFHGLHRGVCRGYICICVFFFLCCMCWFHGHMIPTSCGSDWPGLLSCSCFFPFED